MKLNKRQLIIIALAVVFLIAAAVLVVTLLGLFGGEEEELPQEEPAPEPIAAPILYEVEGSSVTALPVGDIVVVYGEEVEPFALLEKEPKEAEGEELAAETEEADAETAEDTGEESGEESGSQSEEEVEEPVFVPLYRYENLPDDTRVASYCALLTAEDFGFTPVDENMYETELPDFTSMPTGSVHLARPITVKEETTKTVTNEDGEEEEVVTVTETKTGFLFSLRIEWGDGWCTVIPEAWEGRIAQPPAESTTSTMSARGMTLNEALDYVKSLAPQDLGLTGETMDEYKIYALDGAAMVGDTPCLRINIYGNTEQDTNAIAGQYLLTGDAAHVYRLTDAGKVELVF